MQRAWLVVLVGCGPSRVPPRSPDPDPPPAPAAAATEPEVSEPEVSPPLDFCPRDVALPYGDGGHVRLASLQRTRCWRGSCAAYRVVVYRDGIVQWFGEHYVATCGLELGSVSPATVAALEQLFVAAKFLAMPDRLESSNDATDSASATLSYQPLGGVEKTVYHYFGYQYAPLEIMTLEAGFDALVDTAHWFGDGTYVAKPVGAP